MKVPEPSRRTDRGRILLLVSLLVTIFVYWPGLSGSWLFDDYPNIVDNPGVQPHQVSVPALARAALSSPASEFKRPLASLSFAANYLMSGLDPYSWKLVNLIIHLLNGLLVYLLAKALLRVTTTLATRREQTLCAMLSRRTKKKHRAQGLLLPGNGMVRGQSLR